MSANMIPTSVLNEMHPYNHKTIFLMDHSANFSKNCETIEMDVNNRVGFIPLAPIQKSLWTASVETVLEYCRIVWDLFVNEKLIRIIVADNYASNLNTWLQSEQNFGKILEGFANVGAPLQPVQVNNKLFTLPGIISSVQAMCECSEIQHEKRTSLKENKISIVNRCRVIIITSFQVNGVSKIIEDRLQQAILRGNVNAIASDLLIRIDACDLIIINVHANSFVALDDIPKHRVSSILESQTFNVKAPIHFANKLLSLVLSHYNLFSTTVIGIPMKEGINGSSSLSYDVEIFHPAVLHDSLLKGSSIDINSILVPKEGYDYSTITLKWYAPKICALNEIKSFTSVVQRFTPVNVNSRPSQCLMNFLLSGKSVILEVPRRCGKALSHQLSARCGQLYMHSLTIGRSILGNSPSISEGPGGRVTDYRITDFGEFMQNNKLSAMKTPATAVAAGGGGKLKSNTIKQRTRARLEQQTKFWPMTFSSTTIFNYKQNLDPILNLMVKQKLKNCEVIECKKCIYSLVDTDKDETLSACAQRTKTPRKHEQWRHMFYELETFLRDHCFSEKHIDILNCFLDIKCKDFTLDKDKAEFEDAVKELEQLSAEYKVNDIQTRDYTTSSQPVRKTVLELWMDQCAKIKPRAEFAGYSSASLTSNGNLKYKLYASMNKNNNSYRKRYSDATCLHLLQLPDAQIISKFKLNRTNSIANRTAQSCEFCVHHILKERLHRA